MSTHHPPVPGTSNAGPPTHGPGRKHNPTVSYDMEGVIRWYDAGADAGAARVVIHVEAANGHAGRFLGRDVTCELMAGCSAPDGLLPGARVRVHAKMPRELGLHAPDPIVVASIAVTD